MKTAMMVMKMMLIIIIVVVVVVIVVVLVLILMSIRCQFFVQQSMKTATINTKQMRTICCWNVTWLETHFVLPGEEEVSNNILLKVKYLCITNK